MAKVKAQQESRARVADGRFYLDGKPRFLFSGEIHYFRIDAADWDDRLKKAKAAGLDAVSTYVPWRWHETKPGQYDFSGKSNPRRNLLGFIDAVKKAKLRLIIRLGPICNGEMRYEGIPDRVALDPKAVTAPPEALWHSSAPAYLSDGFLKPGLHWFKSLLPIVKSNTVDAGGPIVIVQVDNEIGMVHWIGGLELRSRYFSDYFKTLHAAVREAGIRVPILANIPMFYDFDTRGRGVFAPKTCLMFEHFEEEGVNILGGAYQPRRLDNDNCHDIHLATETVRAVQRDSIAICAETQCGMLFDRPRIYPKDVTLLLQLGAMSDLRGLNLYMLAGGSNPPGVGSFGPDHDWQSPIGPEGDLRPHYRSVANFAKQRDKLERFFAAGEPELPVVLYVPKAYYDPARNKDGDLNDMHAFCFDGLARLLVLAGLPPKWIWSEGKGDLALAKRAAGRKKVFVYGRDRMSAAAQKEILAAVKSGCDVYLGPEFPFHDDKGKTCTVLARALGVKPCAHPSHDSTATILGTTMLIIRKAAPVKVKGAKVIGTFGKDPIAVTRKIGKGTLTYLGVSLSDRQDAQVRVFAAVLQRMGLKPAVTFQPDGNFNPRFFIRKLGREQLILIANMHEVPWSGSFSVSGVGGRKRLALPPRTAVYWVRKGNTLQSVK